MRKQKLNLVARFLVVGIVSGLPLLAQGTGANADLVTIFNSLRVLVFAIMPSIFLTMTALTGWDVYSSRGTVDAVEIPWRRIAISGGIMLGPGALAAGLGVL